MPLRYDPDALDGLPSNQLGRARTKIEWLWANRAAVNHEQLRHDLNPFYKRRAGDLRIIYTYDEESDEMVIWLVGLRDDIYERAEGLQ